jgi:hypothetical protein
VKYTHEFVNNAALICLLPLFTLAGALAAQTPSFARVGLQAGTSLKSVQLR